jgi:hypothetical protein
MAWELTGNSGTDPNANFLGTIDNQPLVIKTNGSEAMRIFPNGHVTVGANIQDDPSTRLQISEGHLGILGTSDTFDQTLWLVNNVGKELRLTVGANAGGTAWYTQANTGTLGVGAGMDLRFSAGAAERMRIIGGNGAVGIGTTAPSAKLHVDSPDFTAIVGTTGHVGLQAGVRGHGFIGIWGSSDDAVGVFGMNGSNQGFLGTRDYAGDFRGNVFILGTSDVAVHGESSDPSTAGTGVLGKGRGAGVTAFNSANNNAAYLASDCCAAWFTGEVYVGGKLTKSSGGFLIDHPLDPSNKYLSHSFVESSDMKNIYDGVVVMDASGEATVELPEWFDAVNIDFRYQLTPIGTPGPNLYIAEEIASNHFKISGGTSGMKVSWQVTGIRKDAWANAKRIQVEEEKSVKERGNYLHPELYGASPEKSIERVRHPAPEPLRPQTMPIPPQINRPAGIIADKG